MRNIIFFSIRNIILLMIMKIRRDERSLDKLNSYIRILTLEESLIPL